MKKILFVIAACLTMSFVSCGNNTSTYGSSNDSIKTDSVEVVDSLVSDSVATDSVASDSVCAL